LSKADGEANAAAMASTAAMAVSGSPVVATCLSEKRARNRTGSGVASEQRLSRRLWTVASAIFVNMMCEIHLRRCKT
jgi:alpha-D-ribose 1-methylphosphonate 5-triphosphate synthase subunit PhnL